MFNGLFHIREPKNEPVLAYAPGSQERAELKAELERCSAIPWKFPASSAAGRSPPATWSR